MRNNDGLLGALGLCVKAGKLVCGTPMICEALKSAKKPYLVLTASDNAPNTAKRLQDRCAFYGVELIRMEDVDGDMLSNAIGKSGRISAVAITDDNLCRLVLGKLEQKSIS